MSFKDSISAYGKQLSAEFKIDNVIYSSEPISPHITGTEYVEGCVISVNPHYEGRMFNTLMKQLDVELIGNYDLKGKTISYCKIGAKVDDSETEYVEFGEYRIKECEYSVADNTTKLECYDKMLDSMKPYELSIDELQDFTLYDWLLLICEELHWTFDTDTTSFVNSDIVIVGEKFNENDTYRDVLDAISQCTGGSLAFKNDGILYLIYPSDSGETIDESNLKSVTVSQQYGPINSLVLSREPQEDNLVREDTESVETYGRTEIKIPNNLIMDANRELFIDNLFDYLDGLTYYIYELESFGIGYLNYGDMFTLSLASGDEYDCLVLNDDFLVNQGANEKLYFEAPEMTETDYSAASQTEKLIRQAQLKVDKQAGTITALTEKVDATMTAEDIRISIQSAVDGIDAITTETNYTFNKDGLNISKSETRMRTVINENGMKVYKGDEDAEDPGLYELTLRADSDGVDAINLTAHQYLTIGRNSRFEDYATDRTGCFWVGD